MLPYAPDAWYVPDSVKVGYEISFTRHFYKPQPLRPLEEIRGRDILRCRGFESGERQHGKRYLSRLPMRSGRRVAKIAHMVDN